jgi:arylformamidase
MGFSISVGHAVDLTQTIKNGMTVYIGDPVPKVTKFKSLAKDGVNISVITMGSHTGTHVDAPVHFVKGGRAVDELPVESFVGVAVVLDFSRKPPGSAITSSDLQEHSEEVVPEDIVLLYTGMSKKWEDRRARRSITYLDGGAANWLIQKRVKAVGIDYLSVEKFGAKVPVAHVTLLSHGIPIIESLNDNLSRLVGHRILFFCLPIKVGGCDGAPARAMAYPLGGRGPER